MTDNNDLVGSDQLPLPLKLLTGEQPSSDVLPLALTRLLGTLDASKFVTSDALPLPLTRLISDQPPSDRLPLALNRLMGTLIDVVVPIDPEPPEYAPLMTALASCINSTITNASNINQCRDWYHNGRDVANDMAVSYSDVVTIAQCYAVRVRAFIALFNDKTLQLGAVWHLLNDKTLNFGASILLINEIKPIVRGSIGYIRCVGVNSAKVAHYQHCKTPSLQHTVNYEATAGHVLQGVGIDKCQSTRLQHAVLVPDRYYPIPDVPVIPDAGACRPRPPSDQLPLPMTRRRNGITSDKLPLPLTCWDATTSIIVPSLDAYIMHNVISATIGGIAVDILSFSIKTDMDSYCWSGGVSVSPDDYEKIKSKVEVDKGLEPIINVAINDLAFSVIAENPTRTRKFGYETRGLEGRSITARLGADYATPADKIFEQASFASQIVNEQLANLLFTANFEIDDWLIPASMYAISNKTPMAVIADIAEAAGGFVESHPTDATMTLKKRWKINAWDLATATPDVTIPADVIKSATDKVLKNTRYNTVLLVGNVGHEVYRSTQGRDMAAPTLSNALFTAREVTVPKGSQVLSDSGTHSIQSLDLIFDDSIPLASLGQIWQVNDTDGAWLGVIASVSIDCAVNNGVPEISQAVTIDRYMDN